jgi:hypothetical protein
MEQWGGPTSLATKLGHANGSYVAQLCGPHPSREVSEKTAREIEVRLTLPAGWMDHPQKAPTALDTDALLEVVAVVRDILEAEGVKATKAQFAALVELTYEHQIQTGNSPAAYARRLIKLIR